MRSEKSSTLKNITHTDIAFYKYDDDDDYIPLRIILKDVVGYYNV